MANPSTRQGLQDYCMRRLGYPVIEIDISDDQIEDRIDEALQFYQERHSDGVIRTWVKHQLSASDITNEYITLDENILYVTRVLKNRGTSVSGMFSLDYQQHLNDLHRPLTKDLLSVYVDRMHMAMLDQQISGTTRPITFSRHMDRITIQSDWSLFTAGDYLIIEAYQSLDPETYTDVYNDSFLKEYLTALLKLQWGSNLKKFNGVQLPGGVELNGQQIFDEAREDLDRLKEEMELRHETPPDFYVG